MRAFRRHGLEIALVAPLAGYVLLLTIAPIVDTFRISLTSDGAASLDNYRAITGSAVFRRAVVNTVIVALLSLALEIGAGLAAALTLHARFRLRGIVRTVMLVPLGVPTIVSGAVLLLVFQRGGYLDSVLGGLSDAIPGWEYRPLAWTVAGGWRTLLTVAVADMWKVLPVVTLIFLAGLQSIGEDLDEAADVDGATRVQRFVYVTFPLLIPYMTMALILRAIDAFRIFELALVLSGRVEPVLGTYIWSRYGPPTSDPATAAAASIVLFAMIMAFVMLYLRVVGARSEIAR